MIKASDENTAIVEALASTLAGLKLDEVIPYEQIQNLIQGKRSLLYRARRKVEDEHGYIFGSVRSQGIKRLSKRTVVVDAALATSKRLWDRTEKRVVNALVKDGGSMSRIEKAELNSSVAHVNAVQLAIKLAKG
jgi:hypothetical protein